jgi:AraC-like DNA-binding protein
MSPEVARDVWEWLGDQAEVVRADRYLAPIFTALAAGDTRAFHAGRAARTLAHCSRATLVRHSRIVLGRGLAHVVMGFRLDSARRLLALGTASIEGVAAQTGFGDVTVLRHAYRRRFGHAPGSGAPPGGPQACWPHGRAVPVITPPVAGDTG